MTAAEQSEVDALRVAGLAVSYGGARAVDDVSFSVARGRVMAVLGPNGVGKSSLARAIAGLVKPIHGTIHIEGDDVTGMAAHLVARRGLAYIPEGRGIFRSMTVSENLHMWRRAFQRRVADSVVADIYEMFPILAQRRDQRAGSLSGGEQQMLALSRAFCIDAKLIVADELSLGLAPRIVDLVFDSLRLAQARGCTILVIEQFVGRALALADECMILQRGAVVWAGSAAEAGDEVQHRYLGAPDSDAVQRARS